MFFLLVSLVVTLVEGRRRFKVINQLLYLNFPRFVCTKLENSALEAATKLQFELSVEH